MGLGVPRFQTQRLAEMTQALFPAPGIRQQDAREGPVGAMIQGALDTVSVQMDSSVR